MEDEHARRGTGAGVVAVSEVAWDPEARLLSFDHQLNAFGPSLDHAVQTEADGFAARHGAIEHLAVGRPTRVVHLHVVGRGGVARPRSLLEHTIGEARRRFLGAGWRRFHVGWNGWRFGCSADLEGLDVEDQHAHRLARPRRRIAL